MTGTLIPNSELVAKTWLLAAVAGLDNNVATSLPDAPWPNDEFIVVMSVGGTPSKDVPMFEPVVSVNCHAVKSNSAKPPWNKAAELAQRVITATYQIRYNADTRVALALPSGYMDAMVTSVWPVSDVTRIQSDPSQFAVYNIDLGFAWRPTGLVVA